MTRPEILDETKKIVCTDRNAQYGEPEDNFGIIAKYWSDYLGRDISAHDVGIMMTLFKVGRIQSGGTKADNYIDACGYLACAGEIATRDTAPSDQPKSAEVNPDCEDCAYLYNGKCELGQNANGNWRDCVYHKTHAELTALNKPKYQF